MAVLQNIALDFAQAEREFADFKLWFSARPRFPENEVVAELKSRAQLSALIGYLQPGLGRPDRFKFELNIQGAFRADYVVGNSMNGRFTLVEFEGGTEYSIFDKYGTNQMRNWSSELQHGFGQIVDWSWAKNESQTSRIYQNVFGVTQISELYVLVCGRADTVLNAIEESRLRWRSEKTIIGGEKVLCLTFDDLLLHFEGTLDMYRATV